MGKRYRLLKDFVIPAGHEFYINPAGTSRKIYVPFAEAVVPLDEDRSADFALPLQEALQLGMIEEIKPEQA